MRVLFTGQLPWFDAPSGAVKADLGWCRTLVRRGHRVRVLVPAPDGPRAAWLNRLQAAGAQSCPASDGIEIFSLDGFELGLAGDRRRLFEALSTQSRPDGPFRPDRILVSEDPTGDALAITLDAARCPVVLVCHSAATLPFGPDSFRPDPDRARRLARVAGIAAVSRYLCAYWQRWGGRAATLVTPHVYGSGPWQPSPAGARGDILMINPSAIKGLPIFVALAARFPDARFTAVASWATDPADRDALAAQPNITVLEAVDDLEPVWRKTGTLLVPSLWSEAFGFVVVEAMLRGIPVLASAVGGLPEAKLGTDGVLPVASIRHYHDAIDRRGLPRPAVPAQDPEPWVRALERLIHDGSERAQAVGDARRAAHAFVAGIDTGALPRLLVGLDRRASDPVPTGAGTPTSAAPMPPADLSAQRRELLLRRMAARTGATCTRRPVGTPVPLTPGQHGLWLLEALQGPGPTYHSADASRIEGPLDVARLERAIADTIARHESLRTAIDARDGTLTMRIEPHVGFTLPVETVETEPADPAADAERAGRGPQALRLARRLRAFAAEPFDLSRAPLLRARLYRLGPTVHVLATTIHHIVTDGWSRQILWRDIGAAYDRTDDPARTAAPPAEAPLQFGDFAVWQQRWIASPAAARERAFWQTTLAGLDTIEMAGDGDRVARGHQPAGRSAITVDGTVTSRLRALGHAHGATLFMVLMAAYQVLLMRRGLGPDVPVGTVVAGRGVLELEQVTGYLANTVVMRGDLSGDPTFVALLGRTRTALVDALSHPMLPFERIASGLGRPRDGRAGINPLFQHFFALHELPRTPLALRGLSVCQSPIDPGCARFDLALTFVPTADGLAGQLEYNAALFSPALIDRLVGQFRRLLTSIVQAPDTPVSARALLDEAAHRALLALGDGPDAAPAGSRTITLIGRQATRTPAAVAIRFQDRSIRYDDLWQRAGRIRTMLEAAAVGPGARVGVCMARGVDLIAALLAVLRLAATWVPLDPEAPAARLVQLAGDAELAAVLCDAASVDRFGALPEATATRIPVTADTPSHGRPDRDPPAAGADDPAYLMFTSGSTGKPKGVVIPHRALENALACTTQRPGMTAGDRVLAVSATTFDVAILEILLPLTVGATLVLAARDVARDPVALMELMRREDVTIAQATPTTWRMLLDAGWTGQPGLHVHTCGEALSLPLARRLRAGCADVWNFYGPTETTIYSTLSRFGAGDREIDIGRPIAGTRIRVVDAAGLPVPLDVPGEIWIAGIGLALGYWRAQALTEERFVTDAAGVRWYRTGDRGRWRADGRLLHLGRLDDQVKLNGQRIEPAEIETLLEQHPAIAQAAVTLRRPDESSAFLVASLVARSAAAVADTDLRAYLRGRLPQGLLPRRFEWLDALPTLVSGKVDRKALARRSGSPGSDPDASGPVIAPAPPAAPDHDPDAPRGATEQAIAGVLQELLGADRIRRSDDLFSLGVDSLLAIRAQARIQKALGIRFPLALMFASPSLGDLASALQA